MRNALILCSGGLDSVALTYSLRGSVGHMVVLFLNYGQRSLMQEEKFAKLVARRLLAEFVSVDLLWLKQICPTKLTTDSELPSPDITDVSRSQKDILHYWVPCRNALFVVIGLAFAESYDLQGKGVYDVYIGIKNEGQVPMKDTTPSFLKAMNVVAMEATHKGNYRVIAPFLLLDKVDILKQCLAVPWGETYSCYAGTEKHCGKCESCLLRKKAFYWGNIQDPTEYLS